MTTPDDAATRPSETGWPSDALPPTTEPEAAEAAPEPTYDDLPAEPAPEQDVPDDVPTDVVAAQDVVAEDVAAPAPSPEVDAGLDAPAVDEPPAPEAEALTPDAADEAMAGPLRPRATPGWRTAPVLALLLTTVLMAIATGFVWYRVHQNDLTESARRAGLETSRDAARVLFSYDYRTLDKDFSSGRAVTTGKFRKQYSDTTSKVVTPVAKEKKAVVKAEVVTAGVVRASPDRVVTIVYVNQVTTSSLTSGPKIDLSRVRMTLSHVGGRWLVSNVEAL